MKTTIVKILKPNNDPFGSVVDLIWYKIKHEDEKCALMIEDTNIIDENEDSFFVEVIYFKSYKK